MIWKRCSRCGKRLPTGQTCECIKNRHKEYDKYSRDKKASAFYHSPDWLRIRAHVLSQFDGMDLWAYDQTGEVVAADTVHHIVPLSENWDLRFDLDNLIPVSASSHNAIHKLYDTKKQATIRKLKSILIESRGWSGRS